jgi:osmoprotectant transport system substrate-binding protein
MVTRRTFAKGIAATPLVGSLALAAPGRALAQDGEPVVIGSKDFTEQFILGEMYALLLEEAGIPNEKSLNLGGTIVAHTALVEGEIDLYPEYTGTGLTEVLEIPVETVMGATPTAGTPAAMGSPAAAATPMAGGIDEVVYQIVAAEYKERFDLVWLDQVPFNNSQALAVERSFSEERGVTTISDLAEIAEELTIVAPSDFVDRSDGLPGLQRVYGIEFGEVLPVAPGIRYQAIEEGQADVVLAFGTDGQITALDMVILDDDRDLWPPYHVAPVVRQETLDAYPNLADALNAVAPLLTDPVMSELNWRVDGPDKEDPADVARSFLEEQGLIGA